MAQHAVKGRAIGGIPRIDEPGDRGSVRSVNSPYDVDDGRGAGRLRVPMCVQSGLGKSGFGQLQIGLRAVKEKPDPQPAVFSALCEPVVTEAVKRVQMDAVIDVVIDVVAEELCGRGTPR